MEDMKLSRQSQPPCLAHPLAAYSRPGVEVSGNVVDAVESHRTEPTMHLHASPLDVTLRAEDHQDRRETDRNTLSPHLGWEKTKIQNH
jgi:hypothetical protein